MARKQPFVGQTGYTIIDLVNKMCGSAAKGAIRSGWEKLAYALIQDAAEICKIREDNDKKSLSLENILERLLGQWVLEKGENALVSELIQVLHDKGFTDLASKLEVETSSSGLGQETQESSIPHSPRSTKYDQTTDKDDDTTDPTSSVEQPLMPAPEITSIPNYVDPYNNTDTTISFPDLPSDASSKSKKKKQGHFIKWFIGRSKGFLQIILLIMVISILFYFISKEWKSVDDEGNNNAIKTPRAEETTTAAPDTEQHKINDFHKGKVPYIMVYSYDDFRRKVIRLPGKPPVEVFINLADPDNWPNDANLDNLVVVKKLFLQGKFHLHKLQHILYHIENVKDLELIDSVDGICTRVGKYASNPSGNPKEYLKHRYKDLADLRSLKFTNFSSCSLIYELFSDNFIVSELDTFHLDNGIIVRDNVGQVQEFIGQVRTPLRKLILSRIEWIAPLLDTHMPTLHNVQEIEMDLVLDPNSPIADFILGTKFCRTFPKLERFTSKAGVVPMLELSRIVECGGLEFIKIGVRVDKEPAKMSFLRNYDFSKKKLEIYYLFPGKNRDDEECEVEESEYISISESNCKNLKFLPKVTY